MPDPVAAPAKTSGSGRLAQHHLAALGTIHERAVKELSEGLSRLLQASCDIGGSRVDQLRAGEFLTQIDRPACCFLFQVEPLKARWMVQLPPALALGMIDLLLGGSGRLAAEGKPPFLPRRPLTELERRLLGRLDKPLIHWLEHAWRPLLDVRLTTENLETRLDDCFPWNPDELLVRVELEARLGRAAGRLQLAVPCCSLASLRQQLLSPSELNRWLQALESDAASPTSPPNVELEAMLAEMHLPECDLAELNVGDIITTDHAVRQPLTILVQRTPRYHAALGAREGRKAIRLDTRIGE